MRVTFEPQPDGFLRNGPHNPSTSSARPLGNDRNAPSALSGPTLAPERPDDAARPGFGFDQPRKQRAHRQPLDVARMDAGKQRLGDVGDGLGPEAAPHEFGNRFIVGARRPGMNSSAAIRNFARQPKQRAPEQRLQPRRESENRRAGQRMQLAVAQDERGPRKLGREEPVAEAQLVAQRDGGRLLHEQRIRPGVDDELADALGHG